MPRDWDARTYDRVSDPMFRWGASVVDGSRFAGDERVLDAGCGTGRVTEFLLERLPRGRVVALDGSPSMIDEARRRLERFGDRVTYVIADLAMPLPLDEPVDAIVSTATFHWVLDHDALFANLAAALRPGGELMAQCGGVGNLTGVASALAELGLDPLAGKHLAAPEESSASPGGGLHRGRVLAPRGVHPFPHVRGARGLPRHGGAGRPPRAHDRGRGSSVRARRRGPHARARARLRAAEHPRPALRLSGWPVSRWSAGWGMMAR